MYTIRSSRPADGQRVVDIWRDAVDATHGFLTSEDRRAIDAEVCSFLPRASLTLAVDRDDRPIGFMLIEGGHMEALFVDPVWHGRGVGATLVRHGLSLRPDMTIDVNEQNVAALRFYEAMSYRQVGRSATDGQGRSYPLIHLARDGRPDVRRAVRGD